MNHMRIIPVLLLKNSRLVKTIKFKNPKYIGDPINALKIFNEKEVDELSILDISAGIEKKEPNFKLIKELASECFMPLSYGGGITKLDHINKLFSIGIEKVVLNSILHINLKLIDEAINKFGSQSIIASIDVKKNFFGKYEIITNSGTFNTKIDPIEFTLNMQKLGVGEILLNSIDRDGTQVGYDNNLLNSITSVTNIPLIACGGAGNLNHMRDAVSLGKVSALAAGSMFVYHGKLNAVLINYPSKSALNKIYE